MKKWIILVIIILVLGSWGGYRIYTIRTTKPAESIEKLQQEAGMPVWVILPKRQDLVETVSISGSIQPYRVTAISPVITERIQKLHVQTGQRVKAGDLLVTLDDTKSRLQVAQANASLAEAKTSLQELENGSRPEEIAMAKSQVQQAEASEKLQRLELDRQRRLYEEQAGTLQQYELAQSQYDNAAAQLSSAKANLELVEQGPRQEQIEMARVRVQQGEVTLDQAKDYLDDHYLRAPFAGKVTLRILEEGDIIEANKEIFRLIDIDRVYLDVDVSELYIDRVSKQMAVEVSIDALGDRPFMGKVEEINPVANMQDRSYVTRIVIDNSDDVLRPGMYGRAHIEVNRYDRVQVIPTDTVRTASERPYVLVVDSQNTVQKVDIETGKTFGDVVHVQSGLDDESRVVYMTREIVRPGDKVTVAESGSEGGQKTGTGQL